MGTHVDEHIESLIGQRVTIEWFDGEKDIGILKRWESFLDGKCPYHLKNIETRINCGGIGFYKSHVKSIKRL